MSLNLHAIAFGVTRAINGAETVTVQVSTGYGTNPSGKRVPAYAPAFNVEADIQDLTTSDIRQLDSLNVTGSMRAIYLNGTIHAVQRLNQKGGDLITMPAPSNDVWLTTRVLEQWPGWCKVSVTLQNQKQTVGVSTPMWSHGVPAPVGGGAIAEQQQLPRGESVVVGTSTPMWPHGVPAPVGGGSIGEQKRLPLRPDNQAGTSEPTWPHDASAPVGTSSGIGEL